MKAALLPVLLVAGAAQAEVPPPDYFTGLYERVGRSAGPEPALLDDLVRIDPAPDGAALELRVCAPGGAPGSAALRLDFAELGDVENLLQGGTGAAALYCQFFNDAGNYPILACNGGAETDEAPARFLLWARTDAIPEDCGG
ncbi:hypothetical protein [Neotabrizicola sp. sgz301269]|uniref:hypothetical protein n=1 Tax=Neotabrizicola sp. sgz301269 TaxID=3276282 RepID=UPI0037704E86